MEKSVNHTQPTQVYCDNCKKYLEESEYILLTSLYDNDAFCVCRICNNTPIIEDNEDDKYYQYMEDRMRDHALESENI